MRKAIRLVSAALAIAALPVLSGCKIQKAVPPQFAGPSELATSIRLYANPDTLRQDGASQSQITIEARDATGQPKGDMAVRVEITVGGVYTDYGQLSAKNLVTGRDGRAYATYTAPPPSTDPVDYGTVVTILVTPTEYDFAGTVMRQVSIRLVPPGIILPPNNPPTADFSFSPGSPNEKQTIQFDASASEDEDGTIVSYSWNFGDGTSASGVTTTHAYDTGGIYTVTLTVTDNRGAPVSTTRQVSVSSTNAPTAVFTLSPSNPTINQTVYFDAAASSAATGRRLVSYSWDFGDGSTGSGVSTSHAYTGSGAFTVTLTVTDDVGKTGATSNSVTVGTAPIPTATIVVSPSAATVNQEVNFDGSLSTAPTGRTISRYEWNFGDGSSDTGVRVDHSYDSTGTFGVVLTVTDSAGAVGRTSTTVVVTGGTNPTAQFAFAPAAPFVRQLVRFDASESTAASGKTLSTYAWNFGDGNTATGIQTSHTFTTPGTFSVVLTVTDSTGLKGAVSRQVVVSTGAPTASFSFSPTSPSVNQMVNFDATASTAVGGKTISTYEWNFQDGGVATGVKTFHTFTIPGTFSVVLTVTDSSGQTATATQNVIVGTGLPTASFSYSPTGPIVNQVVTFDGRASSAVGGKTITGWAWNFGDNSTGTGSQVTHTYTTAGTYAVVLTITDSAGQTATTSQNVTVGSGLPTASFTISPTSPVVNQVVSFDGRASTAVGGRTITSWVWNFGDNSALGSGSQATHTYTTAGTYTVALTVTDSASQTATASQTVTVASGVPTASFTWAPTSPGVGQTVNFDGTPSTAPAGRTISTYAWQFGDGTTGTGSRPSKTYSTAGQITVVLTVTDSAGLTATTSQALTVTTGIPTASFSVSPEPSTTNTAVYLDASPSTASGGATISTYEWNFGDATAIETCPGSANCGASNRTITHTYTRSGTFTITLTVTDSLGRKASATVTHVVN